MAVDESIETRVTENGVTVSIHVVPGVETRATNCVSASLAGADTGMRCTVSACDMLYWDQNGLSYNELGKLMR